MVPSPRGWLFSRLTMQMASKRVCAIVKWHSQPAERAVAGVVPLPAPGRSYNGPISHGLARCWCCQPPGDDMISPSPRGWRVVPTACPAG
jgi:hypothetical protein